LVDEDSDGKAGSLTGAEKNTAIELSEKILIEFGRSCGI